MDNKFMVSPRSFDEQVEKQLYPPDEIYFTGIPPSSESRTNESAFGETEFPVSDIHYTILVGAHLKFRYEIICKLGQGNFAQVIKAFDHKNKIIVAIKIFHRGHYYKDQYLEELEKLNYLNDRCSKNENPANLLYDSFEFRGHFSLVLELLSEDLSSLLMKNNNAALDTSIAKIVIRSICKCLNRIHTENLIHCDLKPANIAFLQENAYDVKLIDMGSSKFGIQQYVGYAQSQYYRAPEVILHLLYGAYIDVWSLGCIAFELITGRILFEGDDAEDQLIRIMEVLGLPPKEMMANSAVGRKYFRANGEPVYCTIELSTGLRKLPYGKSNLGNKRGLPGSKDLKLILKDHPIFADFISKCIQWNPSERMTAMEAISHPWLSNQ